VGAAVGIAVLVTVGLDVRNSVGITAVAAGAADGNVVGSNVTEAMGTAAGVAVSVIVATGVGKVVGIAVVTTAATDGNVVGSTVRVPVGAVVAGDVFDELVPGVLAAK